ncbi:hypothetical protein PRUB_a1534 [Pseudoalteromonas rubra]|uniref:TnsA endonuclease N-terminal domain-containing protein n=1 Tax=Pseudoalteromonas rubra TaxID=43658 RepID=A0A8T0CCP4_9GAMM|nr:heteromeric transposase endonuclease subunit TnsA [Pseudoalteromonas rubra]KAF7788544.1 hypothetical protein PRUB_a1534 [Pseudoalteromonas rubra]
MQFYSSKARKIGVTNRSISGTVPDIGSYESSLERDFMELFRFDSSMDSIVPQPLTIGYFTPSGQPRHYTPDGLLTYKQDLELPPVLYEIKYREDFKGSWRKLMPKFRAAKSLAKEKGWLFKVFTEKEIRGPFLNNVKFLWPYKHRTFDEAMLVHVLTIMSDLQEADPALLTATLFSDKKNQALVIPVIWHLIANFKIGCNLDLPLTMHSKLWTKEDI